MGKKKRKKSFRAAAKTSHRPTKAQQAILEQQRASDQAFQASCNQVRSALTSFHPADVLTALNISDLWQPNRASQIKHQLAFSLLVSTPATSFTSKRITSYEDFAEFSRSLIKALPAFPMLEDYMPEADWGDVKTLLGPQPIAVLYGGPVQRIIDHIEAFRIFHGNDSQAFIDLENAIWLQGDLLQQTKQTNCDQTEQWRPGHIEVPPKVFWEGLVPALTQFSTIKQLRTHYIAELGNPSSWQSQRNSTMP